MLKHLVNLLKGEVTGRVESGFPERVLNLCAEYGIVFWDLDLLPAVGEDALVPLHVKIPVPQHLHVGQPRHQVRRQVEQLCGPQPDIFVPFQKIHASLPLIPGTESSMPVPCFST